jgi:hypothetical protein
MASNARNAGTAVTALSPLELYINATAVIGRHQ